MVQLKYGDTSRPLTDTLLIGGIPIDLSSGNPHGVATVKIIIINNDAPLQLVYKPATILVPSAGTVQYQLTTADFVTLMTTLQNPPSAATLISTTCSVEWEITFADLTQLTVPTAGYAQLRINPDLA